MQPRVSQIFGSYDLFAKSFPGLIFLIISTAFLPSYVTEPSFQATNVTFIAFVLVTIVFGFAIGQVLHSVAVDVEKGVYLAGSYYYNVIIFLKIFTSYMKTILVGALLRPDHERVKSDSERSGEGNFGIIGWISLIYTCVAFLYVAYVVLTDDLYALFPFFLGIAGSLALRSSRWREWFLHVLNPHRQTFIDEIEKDKELPTVYCSSYQKIFGKDDDEGEDHDNNLKYMMTMSYLENIGAIRSRQFQATFSFCRSMWVILLFYSFLFLVMSTEIPTFLSNLITGAPETLDYVPVILTWTNQAGLFTIGIIMFVLAILFMEGERQYKSLFVSYIMVDFLTSTNGNSPDARDSNKGLGL